MPTSDLDQTLLPFQRRIAWALIGKGGKIANDATDWLRAHPEPVLEEMQDEGKEIRLLPSNSTE